MRHYLKYSLVLHCVLLGALVLMTYLWKGKPQQNLRFTILPKGTSLDAVLTPELAQEATRATPSPNMPSPSITPSLATPSPTHEHFPPPTLHPEGSPAAMMASGPPAVSPTPNPSPATPVATPSPTAPPTPVPKKTVVITPKTTPKPPTPGSSPPANASSRAAQTRRGAQRSPAPSSAHSASSGKSSPATSRADLPRQLPRGVTPRPAAGHEEVGVPGVAEGVEGAPLPLDRTQSLLSALYATRARMKIQSNFTVPPDVNDPNLTCVVEWEIMPDGTIRNIRIVQSTGIARLDACAVEALRKTANLGPLPPEWGNRSVWTSLTFMFAGDLPPTATTDAEPASANPRASSP